MRLTSGSGGMRPSARARIKSASRLSMTPWAITAVEIGIGLVRQHPCIGESGCPMRRGNRNAQDDGPLPRATHGSRDPEATGRVLINDQGGWCWKVQGY